MPATVEPLCYIPVIGAGIEPDGAFILLQIELGRHRSHMLHVPDLSQGGVVELDLALAVLFGSDSDDGQVAHLCQHPVLGFRHADADGHHDDNGNSSR